MNYTGFYLNLDRSADRRERIEAELARNGLRGYGRFISTDGNALKFPNPGLKNSEIGCFTSHWRVLRDNADHAKPLHIIEDDILLSAKTEQVIDWAIASGQLDHYDIVYTDVAVPLLNDACHAYKAYYDATVQRDEAGKITQVAFSVVDMRELIFASMCSSIINPASIGKLAGLYEAELQRGATLPVDLFLRQLCQNGTVRIGCIFPFVTSIRPESCLTTTMEKRFEELPALAANMLRHSFFIDCDWQHCMEQAQKLFPQPAADDQHRQLFKHLLGYSLMPDYSRC